MLYGVGLIRRKGPLAGSLGKGVDNCERWGQDAVLEEGRAHQSLHPSGPPEGNSGARRALRGRSRSTWPGTGSSTAPTAPSSAKAKLLQAEGCAALCAPIARTPTLPSPRSELAQSPVTEKADPTNLLASFSFAQFYPPARSGSKERRALCLRGVACASGVP